MQCDHWGGQIGSMQAGVVKDSIREWLVGKGDLPTSRLCATHKVWNIHMLTWSDHAQLIYAYSSFENAHMLKYALVILSDRFMKANVWYIQKSKQNPEGDRWQGHSGQFTIYNIWYNVCWVLVVLWMWNGGANRSPRHSGNPRTNSLHTTHYNLYTFGRAARLVYILWLKSSAHWFYIG